MSELKEAEAALSVHIYVNCPNCQVDIDLLDEEDTGGYNCDEESYLLQQVIGETPRKWENFECEEVTCTKCDKEFNVKGIIY